MDIEKIRELCREEFYNNIMTNIDSTIIFTYVNRLENKYNNIIKVLEEFKKWLEEQHQFIIEIPAYTKEISQEHKTMEICYENVLDKLNELLEKNNDGTSSIK